jgi:hypothetical protein
MPFEACEAGVQQAAARLNQPHPLCRALARPRKACARETVFWLGEHTRLHSDEVCDNLDLELAVVLMT